MKRIHRLIDFLHKEKVAFAIGAFGAFAMGSVNLITCLIRFDWILLNYALFFYAMVAARIWLYLIKTRGWKPSFFVAGSILAFTSAFPMTASFVLTILYKEGAHYPLDWLIYAYAAYGTIKMVFAIKGLAKKKKEDYALTLSLFSMLSALYTLQMMEFQLIMFASKGTMGNEMYYLLLFTQGFIFLFAIFVSVYLALKQILRRKKEIKVEG